MTAPTDTGCTYRFSQGLSVQGDSRSVLANSDNSDLMNYSAGLPNLTTSHITVRGRIRQTGNAHSISIMVNTGSHVSFISKAVVAKHYINLLPLAQPIIYRMFTGESTTERTVNVYTEVELTIGSHVEQFPLLSSTV